MSTRIESLALIETACWQELVRATKQREHGWRVMTLATVDGERADARSVVLREADAQARTLRFYTDARSPKLAQMSTHPLGTLLLWSAALTWQLRLRVRLQREGDEREVSSRWDRMKELPSAQDCLSPQAPGERLVPGGAEPDGQAHFAVINAQVLSTDWLELHPYGHRRAVFEPDEAYWVQP